MKKLLISLFACCLAGLPACKKTSINTGENSEFPPVDVRLCCYGEFFGEFGNSISDEVGKVIDNVNSAMTWDYITNSHAADSTSFGDDKLRINALWFADEFRCLEDSVVKIVCLTTCEIFDCFEREDLKIVNGVTYPDNLGSVVSVAAMTASDNVIFDCTRLVLYELAHQYGAGNCDNPHCVMSNHAEDRWIKQAKSFCPKCKMTLEKEGWHLEKW